MVNSPNPAAFRTALVAVPVSPADCFTLDGDGECSLQTAQAHLHIARCACGRERGLPDGAGLLSHGKHPLRRDGRYPPSQRDSERDKAALLAKRAGFSIMHDITNGMRPHHCLMHHHFLGTDGCRWHRKAFSALTDLSTSRLAVASAAPRTFPDLPMLRGGLGAILVALLSVMAWRRMFWRIPKA